MGIDVVMFDITDASWDQVVAELRSMEGRRCAASTSSVTVDDRAGPARLAAACRRWPGLAHLLSRKMHGCKHG